MKSKMKRDARARRHRRLRRAIRGTGERPRLAVYRSNSAIYAQVIDDTRGHTLVSAASIEEDLPAVEDDLDGKMAVAAAVGKLVAERSKAAGIERVVFDRGGNRYHGRVKALADAARESGLEF